MGEITDEIKAYEEMRNELEVKFMGKWVLIYDGKLVDTYESFEEGAKDAVEKFGSGPFLLRQVGAAAVILPASVVYRLSND